MNNVAVLDARQGASGGYRVDVGPGERIGRVSSEWFNRPADERYLSLTGLMAARKGRAERSRIRTAKSAAVRVEARPASGVTPFLNKQPIELSSGQRVFAYIARRLWSG